jgi:hypothetical protein
MQSLLDSQKNILAPLSQPIDSNTGKGFEDSNSIVEALKLFKIKINISLREKRVFDGNITSLFFIRVH